MKSSLYIKALVTLTSAFLFGSSGLYLMREDTLESLILKNLKIGQVSPMTFNNFLKTKVAKREISADGVGRRQKH